jgi:hypothetical protein
MAAPASRKNVSLPWKIALGVTLAAAGWIYGGQVRPSIVASTMVASVALAALSGYAKRSSA